MIISLAALCTAGCEPGTFGGRAIGLLGNHGGGDGVLPVRQSSSCNNSGGYGQPGYPGYPSQPGTPDPSQPSQPGQPGTPDPSQPAPNQPAPPTSPGPTAGSYGAACNAASDCTSGPCVRGPDGVAFCTKPCSPTTAVCPVEAGCHATSVTDMYVCGKPAANGTTPQAPPTPGADTQKPTVYITAPITGSSVAAKTVVRANVSDNVGISSVELHIDGMLAASTTAGPYQFPVQLSPGKHTLMLRAVDLNGNKSEATATVTVAGAGPEQPQPGATQPGPTQPGPTQPQAGTATYGQPCTQPGQCLSGLCANDLTMGVQYCSQNCTPGANACPGGSGCYAASAGVYVCAPEPTQNNGGAGQSAAPGAQGRPGSTQAVGCSAAGADGGAVGGTSALVLLTLLGLALARRRRRA